MMPQQRTALEEFVTDRWDRDTARDIPDQAAQIAAHNQGANDVEWDDAPTTTHTHAEIDAALGRAAHKDDVRELRQEMSALRADLWSRRAAGAETFDWKADLYMRLTSRKLWVFVAGLVTIIVTTWQASPDPRYTVGAVALAVAAYVASQAAEDAAIARRGHRPAPAPREMPHAD